MGGDLVVAPDAIAQRPQGLGHLLGLGGRRSGIGDKDVRHERRYPVPAAATRASASASMVWQRGSSRIGSKSGSDLAELSRAIEMLANTGPSRAMAASASGRKGLSEQAKLERMVRLSGAI